MTACSRTSRSGDQDAGPPGPVRRPEEVAAAVSGWQATAGVRHRGRHPGRRWTRNGSLTDMGILEGKRILVAGVTMDTSIGFAVAKVAQEQGATVLISNFGRALGITRRIAKRLPPAARAGARRHRRGAPGRAARTRCGEHVDGLDGVVHSIAYGNPETLLGGKFLDGPWPDVAQAVQVSAYSLMSLDQACRPLIPTGGSVVGLTFDATVAWPAYDWMGVAKAGPRVALPLPGPRPRPRRHPGQPGLGRTAGDAGRQGDPGLRGARGVWAPGPARVGQEGRGAHGPGGVRPAVGLLPGHHRRDRARRRRLSRDGCRPAERPGGLVAADRAGDVTGRAPGPRGPNLYFPRAAIKLTLDIAG